MEKIKEYMRDYFPIVLCFLICLCGAIYILCRGSYGTTDNNVTGTVERVESGLERTDDRVGNAQGELDGVESELDRAAENAHGIAGEVSDLRESVDGSQKLIDESADIVSRSEERNQRMQNRFRDIEKANAKAESSSKTR